MAKKLLGINSISKMTTDELICMCVDRMQKYPENHVQRPMIEEQIRDLKQRQQSRII